MRTSLGFLVGITLNLFTNLRRNGIFAMVSLPIHEHGMSAYFAFKFHSLVFCIFQCASPVHVLLDLYPGSFSVCFLSLVWGFLVCVFFFFEGWCYILNFGLWVFTARIQKQ